MTESFYKRMISIAGIATIATLCVFAGMLTACGKKADLYLLEKPVQEQVPTSAPEQNLEIESEQESEKKKDIQQN